MLINQNPSSNPPQTNITSFNEPAPVLDKTTAGFDYFSGKLSSKEYERILASDDSDN